MKTSIITNTILLLVFTSLIGCSSQDESSDPISETKSEDALVQPESESSMRVIEFQKKATYATTDELIITGVSGIAVDENDRVFIKDDRQSAIHIFDEEGSYVTSLGREGRGPSEFSSQSSETKIEVGPDNKLYATDGSGDFAYRAQVFNLDDLSFSNTLKLRAENLNDYADLKGHTPKYVFPGQDETFLVVYYPGILLLKNSEIFIHFVIQNREGEIISEPILKVKDRVYLSEIVETPINSMTVMHDFPFSPKTVFDVANNGEIYTAWTSEFKIDVYSPEGELFRSIEHPFENLPLDIEKLRAHYKETNYMSQLGEGVTEKILEQEENIPAVWPAINDLLIDDENRLWVSALVKDQDIYEWWIMENNGEVITQFEWPRDKPIEIIRNGNIYTREEQADTGEEEVVRYEFGFGG